MSEDINIEAYIRYRMEKGNESYLNACLLANNNAWNAAINRLYYACYYTVSALLLSKQIKAQSHAGVKSQFGLHFVKTGIISKDSFRLYSDLMDWRQKGDYGDLFNFSQDVVMPLLTPVKVFIDQTVSLIEGNRNLSE